MVYDTGLRLRLTRPVKACLPALLAWFSGEGVATRWPCEMLGFASLQRYFWASYFLRLNDLNST